MEWMDLKQKKKKKKKKKKSKQKNIFVNFWNDSMKETIIKDNICNKHKPWERPKETEEFLIQTEQLFYDDYTL